MIRYRVYTKTGAGSAGAVRIDRDFDTYIEAWDRMVEFLNGFRDDPGHFEDAVKRTYINEIITFSEGSV